MRWFFPATPRARVAWVRSIVAVFAVVDALFLLTTPRGRAHTPDFYQPVPLAELAHLPAPSSWSAALVLVGIVCGAALLVLGGRRTAPAWLQRVGGPLLALTYLTWCLWSMSFGYVAHDHMAIAVAVAVLPTAGVCRYGQVEADPRAGWALRMVQLFTVLTYTGSVLAKAVINDWDLVRWANSGTLAWAFLRRGNPLNSLLVEQAALLRVSQWGALALELAAPLVFLVRERWRWLVVVGFLGFHATTFALLGIHFLPTVVCWSAFLPWERWLSRPTP
ncbi:hypothetical protein ACTMMA_17160 [Ornithinimicrobium panacihumi]